MESLLIYLVLVYFGALVVKMAIDSFERGKYFGFGLYLFNTIVMVVVMIKHIINL